jgi:hypothetical protein
VGLRCQDVVFAFLQLAAFWSFAPFLFIVMLLQSDRPIYCSACVDAGVAAERNRRGQEHESDCAAAWVRDVEYIAIEEKQKPCFGRERA